MAYGPVRFGETGAQYSYTFPFVEQMTDNFANLTNPIADIPSMDGGFDMFGVRPGKAPVGQVSVSFNLFSEDGTTITDLRDLASAMASWGVQRLYYTPAGVGLTDRWCYARLIGLDRAEDLSGSQHRRPIVARFAVADPFWYSIGNYESDARWGVSTWGSFLWGGKAGTSSTVFSVTPGGTANTFPLIIIKVDTPTSYLINPVITRKVDGVVMDRLTFTGTLTGDPTMTLLQMLRIDPAYKSVKADATDWYGNMVALNPEWMQLDYGVQNDIIISGDTVANITTQFLYYDRWR